MKRRFLKFLWRLFLGLVGLLALWLLHIFLLTFQVDREFDRARSQLVKQFPKMEANASALQLQALTAKLWKSPPLRSDRSNPSQQSQIPYEFNDIRQELGKFFENFIKKTTNQKDVPPDVLTQYLAKNAANLEAIRLHVLNSDLPRQQRDFDQLFQNLLQGKNYPSFLSMVSLHQVLVLEALEKQRLGQTQKALDTLEVSWRINQPLYESPEAMSFLVARIVERIQLATLRKLDGLPAYWKQRLLAGNYHQLYLKVMESEVWFSFASSQGTPVEEIVRVAEIIGLKLKWNPTILGPLAKPYLHASAADYSRKMRRAIALFSKVDVCSDNEVKVPLDWWAFANPVSSDVSGSEITLSWQRVRQMWLDRELTRKILQIQELQRASKLNQWPQKIAGIETSICPDAQWIYQVSSDRKTMSIFYSKPLEKSTQTGQLPLTYSATLPKKR